ncbi:hypothetical protein Taro_030174, partial [Colocasia esculenta]|nr:hypothetical protein [Colocasia esculenta]
MDGKIGRLGAESADSERNRPMATRFWGGNNHPPMLVDLGSARLQWSRLGSGSAGSDPAPQPDYAIHDVNKRILTTLPEEILTTLPDSSRPSRFSGRGRDRYSREISRDCLP